MKTDVHILATCRKPELLPAMLLVFKTLRIGFPTSHVTVWINELPDLDCEKALMTAMELARVDRIGFEPGKKWEDRKQPVTIHHKWIEELVQESDQPFYVLDTDVIFWSDFEKWDWKEAPMAGRYIPEFFDEFTKCVTRRRLHTSLLYLNPVEIKKATVLYSSQFPKTVFNPQPNLYYPCQYPFRDDAGRLRTYFNDTCSLLWQVVRGAIFYNDQLNCYDHLHFGTISDIVAPHYPGYRWRETHFAIFENNELARHIWKSQDEFYQRHRT